MDRIVSLLPAVIRGDIRLNTEQSLPQWFGLTDTLACIDAIKQTQSDAVLRTQFRFVWPLEYDDNASEILKNQSERSAILAFRLDGSGEENTFSLLRRQQALLHDWIACTAILEKFISVRGSVDRSEAARLISHSGILINELKRLRSLLIFQKLFVNLLIDEGVSEPKAAVEEAFYRVRDEFLSLLIEAFVSEWQRRRYFPILETIRKQEDIESLSPNLFEKVFALGVEEKHRIDGLDNTYQGWQTLNETIAESRPILTGSATPLVMWRSEREQALLKDFSEANRLHTLIRESDGLLETKDWLASVRQYETTVARSMIACAYNYYNNPSTYADALEVFDVVKSRSASIEPALLGHVEREIIWLEEAMKTSS